MNVRSIRIRCAAAMCLVAAARALQAQDTLTTGRAEYATGHYDGQLAGRELKVGGWFRGGLVSGMLLTFVGTGAAFVAATSSSVNLSTPQQLMIAHEARRYQQGYEAGYKREIRSRRMSSAVRGGLMGTGIALTFFVLMTSGSSG